MILTCPNCDTKYVVKDGSIPAGGRQVRCAACKHSWHEAGPGDHDLDGDVMASPAPTPPVAQPIDEQPPTDEHVAPPPIEDAFGGPPPADPDYAHDEPVAQTPPLERSEALVSDYREPAVEGDFPPPPVEAHRDEAFATQDRYEPYEQVAVPAADDDFAIPDMDEDRPRSRAWLIVLVLVALVAAAAAAFWFLAPSDLKARVGLASAGSSKLEVMLTNNYRQKLASGNELLAISGRVINPTDVEQAVPPIRASLRNKTTRKVIYEWTIAPPTPTLAPRDSRPFNSAEVDIPEGGDELTVTLGAAAS